MRPLALLLLLTLCACELAVEVDVPPVDPLLVVDAPFETGQPWQVRLSRSVPVQEGESWSEAIRVSGAVVEIYSNGALVERLTERDECVNTPDTPWRCDDGSSRQQSLYTGTTAPRAGQTYTLRATHPQFAPVEATDVAPFPVDASRLAWTAENRSLERDGYVENRLRATLDIAGGTTPGAFYALAFEAETAYPDTLPRWWPPDWPQFVDSLVTTGAPRAVSFRSAATFFLRSDSDPFDLSNERRYETGYFTGEAFEGERLAFAADIDSYSGTCYFSPETGLRFCEETTYYGIVHALSPAYFEYARTLLAYESGGGGENPLSEPVRVQGNIEGGLGLFAGRARTGAPLRP